MEHRVPTSQGTTYAYSDTGGRLEMSPDHDNHVYYHGDADVQPSAITDMNFNVLHNNPFSSPASPSNQYYEPGSFYLHKPTNSPIQDQKSVASQFSLDPDQNFIYYLQMVTKAQDPRAFLENFSKIADGSSSVVLQAIDKYSRQRRAIKKININHQKNKQLLLNEIAVMKTLSHPHVISYMDSFLLRDEVWIVMEYMDGGNMAGIVTSSRMDEQQVATISKSILEALSYIHQNYIIHRDVKSDSILLRRDGLAKLSDFGHSVQLTTSQPRRNSLAGTPYWMSPEVISKEPYNFSPDIWSFGITVFEMIDGEPPYFNDQPFQAMRRIKEGPPPKLRNILKVSPRLEGFVEKIMTKDAALRPTAVELLGHPFLKQASSHYCLLPLIKK